MKITREDWVFKYTGEEIHTAIVKKLAYHQERLSFWAQEQADVEKEIQSAGYSIKTHQITGGHRADVQIDQTLLTRLTEAESKLGTHRGMIHEYTTWEKALARNSDKEYDLTPGDIRYFEL